MKIFGTLLISVFLLNSNLYSHEVTYEVDLFCQDMNVVIQKMQVASSNIANINTTRTSNGGAYKRQYIESCIKGHCIVKEDDKSILKYEPNHPDAKSNGYVAYPNINLEVEKANLIKASRVYDTVVSNSPFELKSIDLLVGDKFNECFKKYHHFKESFDYKKFLGR